MPDKARGTYAHYPSQLAHQSPAGSTSAVWSSALTLVTHVSTHVSTFAASFSKCSSIAFNISAGSSGPNKKQRKTPKSVQAMDWFLHTIHKFSDSLCSLKKSFDNNNPPILPSSPVSPLASCLFLFGPSASSH